LKVAELDDSDGSIAVAARVRIRRFELAFEFASEGVFRLAGCAENAGAAVRVLATARIVSAFPFKTSKG